MTDEDSPEPGPVEALIEFSAKGYDAFYWVIWPATEHRIAISIGWPMNTKAIPQGNQSNGRTMWAYSDRVH